MDRYAVRKIRRSEICHNLQDSSSCDDLCRRAFNMPKHLFATFSMDLEMYIKSETHTEIVANGDYDFFMDNAWYSKFDMEKIYNFFRKERMI